MQHYQQPIDITIQADEECYFRVLGCHTVHLTGNYVLDDTPDSDEEEDDDSEEEEESYDALDNMLLNPDTDSEEDESEEDELDSLAHPRITELEDEEDEAPQLIRAGPQKSAKKRPVEEDEEAEAVTGSSAKADDSGKSNRHSKKLKTNTGDAVAGGKSQPSQKTEVSEKTETKKDQAKNLKPEKKESNKKSEQSQTNGKKVQFADKLEQGPTPPKSTPKGPKNVNGVMVDDKKTGTGPAAKKGDKVGMRYIGKLKDGKVFDGMCILIL
jgi:FK506-binding nuclear protein